MRVKIKAPSSLKDIKLSQYQKFVRTTEDKEDINFINRQKVSIFCNIKDEYIGKIKKSDYDDLIVIVDEILKEKSSLQPIIRYDGEDYGFIPKNFEDITVDELADLDSYIKDVQTYDKAMNVLYRPIKSRLRDQYLIRDYDANGQGLDLPLDVVMGALVFFSNLTNDLLSYTQNYLIQEMAINKKLRSLVENGGGIKTFTHSVKETFSGLRTLVN